MSTFKNTKFHCLDGEVRNGTNLLLTGRFWCIAESGMRCVIGKNGLWPLAKIQLIYLEVKEKTLKILFVFPRTNTSEKKNSTTEQVLKWCQTRKKIQPLGDLVCIFWNTIKNNVFWLVLTDFMSSLAINKKNGDHFSLSFLKHGKNGPKI